MQRAVSEFRDLGEAFFTGFGLGVCIANGPRHQPPKPSAERGKTGPRIRAITVRRIEVFVDKCPRAVMGLSAISTSPAEDPWSGTQVREEGDRQDASHDAAHEDVLELPATSTPPASRWN